MDSDTPQTALWPTWLGAILLVPLAAGLERLAWYGFRSQLFYRFMAFDLDLSSAPYTVQGVTIIIGALVGALLAALIGPQIVAIVGTLGLLVALALVDVMPVDLLTTSAAVIAGFHGFAAVGHIASLAVLLGRARPMLRYAGFLVIYGTINSGALISSTAMQVFGRTGEIMPGVAFALPLGVATLLMAGAAALWWKAPPLPAPSTPAPMPIVVAGALGMTLATLLAMSLMVPYNPAFYDVIWTLPEPWPRILPSLNPVLVLLVTGVLSLLLLGLSAMRYRLPMMPLAALGLLLLGLATFSGLIISGPLAVLVVAGVALAEAVAIPFLYARAGTDLPWRAVALPYALIIAAPQIVYMIPAGEWLKQIVGGVVLVGLALFVGVGGSLLELKTDGGLRLRPAEAE